MVAGGGLITSRSQVQILSPPLKHNPRVAWRGCRGFLYSNLCAFSFRNGRALPSTGIDKSILDRENDVILDRIFAVEYLLGHETHSFYEHIISSRDWFECRSIALGRWWHLRHSSFIFVVEAEVA